VRGNRLAAAVIAVCAVGVVAALALLLFRSTGRGFTMIGGSMEPTLQVGEHATVEDADSFERGDIVVLRLPEEELQVGVETVVARVIGLPGETVQTSEDGVVLIDRHRLHEPYLRRNTTTEFFLGVPPGCETPADGTVGCVVPRGRVFVMGDNRGVAKDSRAYGTVPETAIEGRVS
jgi:signal peptidase I